VSDLRYGEIFNNRLIPNFTHGVPYGKGTVGIAPVGIAFVGIGTASPLTDGLAGTISFPSFFPCASSFAEALFKHIK